MSEVLSSLDTYSAMVNSNIDKFNEYAKINYEELTSRSESCNDLVSKHFKIYLAAGDKGHKVPIS